MATKTKVEPKSRKWTNSDTWAPGDYVVYADQPDTETFREMIVPGLFWYSGFGMGTYFSREGKALWRSATDAGRLAKIDGTEFKFADCLRYYQATAVSDR